MEFAKQVFLALVSGGVVAGIVLAISNRAAWKRERQAVKEDRAEQKADKTEKLEEEIKSLKNNDQEAKKALDKMQQQIDATAEGVKLMLLDRVLYLGQSYIEMGEISYDDRRRFHQMHECYHNRLEGNGDADLIVESVDELPLKH